MPKQTDRYHSRISIALSHSCWRALRTAADQGHGKSLSLPIIHSWSISRPKKLTMSSAFHFKAVGSAMLTVQIDQTMNILPRGPFI
jgi:hypothetical protein